MNELRLGVALSVISLVAVLAVTLPAAADTFPIGVFSMEMGSDEWVLTFDRAGHYTATRQGAIRAEGSYQVTQNSIEFIDKKGPKAHTGEARSGSYTWVYQGNRLVFTLVADQAEGRPEILTFQPWNLVRK